MSGLLVAVVVLCQIPVAARAQGTAAETLELRKWVAAKFGDCRASGRCGQPDDPHPLRHRVAELPRGPPADARGTTNIHRGLFTHAPSDVLVKLPGPGREFTARVGVDTNEQTRGGQGSVIFTVATPDAQEAFQSPVLREGMAGVPVRVDLAGATEFHLQVSDAGDGVNCDQAVWIDAQVTLADGRVVWIGDLPIVDGPLQSEYTQDPPFSFKYGDRTFAELWPRFDARVEYRAAGR